ncbi:hypothetical protein ACHAXH_003806 [Discostella pseudostelligera]
MLLQSEESMYEMMDDGNEQLPPDHYLLHNDWSPPEMSIDDFSPMPPLPPNDFLPMSPLPPMQMPPLLVQSTTETTPPIPQTFSNLSFEGESTKLNTYSPSLDEFLPADNNMHHFDHSTVGDVQSDRNVPSLGISHPSSVCLPSLDEHHEYFPSTFGNNEPSTQYFSGSNAMQEAIYSTPTTTYASLQNTTDANLFENAFSLTEAEMADDIAPGVYATTTAPLLSPSVEEDDRWSQKFKDLQEYKAKHGNCDVKQTEGKLGYWVNKQRNEKKLLDDGKVSHMTPERVRLLTKIGFKWPEPRVQIWDKHFNELVEYKRTTGHCNFPTKPKEEEYKKLGRWVTGQRNRKKKGKISREHEAKLNSIGFVWNLKDIM